MIKIKKCARVCAEWRGRVMCRMDCQPTFQKHDLGEKRHDLILVKRRETASDENLQTNCLQTSKRYKMRYNLVKCWQIFVICATRGQKRPSMIKCICNGTIATICSGLTL
jgi:hypothetical protein